MCFLHGALPDGGTQSLKGVLQLSMPNFPADTRPIGRDEAVNQILASIALEELSLSHILNAGGEGLQHVLGMLPGQSTSGATPGEIVAANESVRNLLEMSAQNQVILQEKMETALCGCGCCCGIVGPTGATGATGPMGPAGVTGATGAAGATGTFLIGKRTKPQEFLQYDIKIYHIT